MSPAAAPPGAQELWASFTLGEEVFAVRADAVQEVITEHPATPVPLAPPHVVGLINLRGQIVPAIDLRRRLGRDDRGGVAAGATLILDTPEGWVGVEVDAIGDVLTLPAAAWRPSPDTLTAADRRVVSAICPQDGHIVMALDVARLAADDGGGGGR